ncbi:hypothetical protein EDB92DRAFT_2053993 [Lactarius akahatsu]|uniref:Phospholipase/carboxylesterase/thioesterase domain-containing protein n=1 Tax=Lactarius akahatsu TaxID=416441 RepID=A0AAD4QDG0_9AGAM|nr:hypothetical protein EDB92DRAFT_2053993 [Lactarius akahatsu]
MLALPRAVTGHRFPSGDSPRPRSQSTPSTMASELHLEVEAAPVDATRRKVKPPPQSTAISAPFDYSPSDDGTDENLLVLLHGLGDTHLPFGKLGRSFKLPQTATLALRAPEQIPYLYEQAFQWYPSFDPLGDVLAAPRSGGSVAAESAQKWWRRALQLQQTSDNTSLQPFGSVVTVGGPLLSYPTLSALCTTPVLVFHRPPPAEPSLPRDALPAFRKGFTRVIDVEKSGEGMPRSRDEWHPIMQLWSERLGRRQVDGFYEVMTGANAA